MKNLLIAALTLLAVAQSHAQIVVYKLKLTVTSTGNHLTTKSSETGYFIVDFSTSDSAFIEASANKHFSIFEPDFADYDFGPIDGAKGSHQWQFTLNEQYGSVSMLGKTVTINLGGTNNYALPKTMTFSGSVVTLDDNDVRTLAQFKGTLALDTVNTTSANQSGDVLSDTEDRITTFLQHSGYILDP
jgi:hypothetical protein